MEAFQNAITKTILAQTRNGFDSDTQFRVLDVFDSFDPARPNARELVTAWYMPRGANTCLAGAKGYTLKIRP
jgi:hypothetical protein